jgi:MYXO-CTERM domain-containing protein
VITLAARGDDPVRVVVVADDPADPMTYTIAKPGPTGSEHVILDAPAAADGTVGVTAAADGDRCKVTLSATGGALRVATGPAAITVDASCTAKDAAPRKAGATPKLTSHPGGPSGPRRGGGCCSGSATPASSTAMAVIVLALIGIRRRVPRAPTS